MANSQVAQQLWRWLQAGCVLQLGLLVALAASCQGAQPTAPATPQSPTQFPTAIPPGLIVEDSAGDGSLTGQGVLGAYRFIFDVDAQTARLEPIQRAGDALGDPFTADITGLLSGNPCNDCFKVDAVGRTPDGYVYVDYELRHPFPLPANNPPQFGDRLDLHVYDVRGIFLKPDPKDSLALHQYTDLFSGGSAPETLMVDNSGFLAGITIDGQTSAFDTYTDSFYPTQANVHPYVMMHTDTRVTNFDAGSDNGWTDLYDPIGHNVFPQGGGPFTRRVVFTASPGQTVEYLVVLAANFASAAQGNGLALGKRGNPAYYLPWANTKSPWRVRVEETSNTLEAGNSTSDARLRVTVYDWQHHLGVLTTVESFRAENQSRNSLLRPSRVLDIEGSIPGVTPASAVNAGLLMGAGTPQSPLVYEVICPNTLEATEGTYLGALAIRDDYTAGEVPEGFGTGFTPFVLDDYSTYVTFSVEVAPAAGGGSSPPFSESAQVYNNNSPNPNPDAIETLNLDNGTLGNLGISSKVGQVNEYVFAVAEASGFTSNARSQVAFCASANGGLSFGLPQLMPIAGSNDQQKDPTLLVNEDSLGVPWIHMAWAGRQNNGDYDIYYTRSSDLGTTWMTPNRVAWGGDNQITPALGANPLNPRDIFLAMEESGSKSRILLLRDSNSDGEFGQEKEIDLVFSTTRRRTTPAFVFPPSSADAPYTFSLVYRRADSSGSDIMVTSTTTGYAGLGQVLQGVSDENLVQVAVDPSALYALGPSGLDLLIAYNQQTLLSVANQQGGYSVTISASQLKLARKRAGQSAFDPAINVGDTDAISRASQPVLLRTSDDLGHAVLLTWSDDRNRYTSGQDIFLATSADRGATWTPDALLVGSGGHQRNPSLVSNVTGQLRLLYRDENRKTREMIRLAQGGN